MTIYRCGSIPEGRRADYDARARRIVRMGFSA